MDARIVTVLSPVRSRASMELICGSERCTEIHRGVPRMSRTLLAQRLKHLERGGIIERRDGPTYHLTAAGQDLEPVVFAMGD